MVKESVVEGDENEEATIERVPGGDGGCQPARESPLFVSPPGEISAKFTVETRPINFIPLIRGRERII